MLGQKSLRVIGQRRMMQDDTQPTYLILFVTPAFVHLGDVPVFVGKRHCLVRFKRNLQHGNAIFQRRLGQVNLV